MKKQKKKPQAPPAKQLGAPRKPESMKIRTDHLRQDQWQRMEDEAALRGHMSTWAFIRLMLDWGITALDTKRGDVDAHKLFDDLEEVKDENKK